ncbi:SpoIIE family protein phosphatase [Skermania sp. ID1734]|nr:SpoIIE family protein phosphatase [Skermania sp. ID1734]
MLEDSAEDLYENAPCGYLSTRMDGTIAKINATLLGWLGYDRSEVVGRRRFSDLLTVGGRIYFETHFAPLLQMQGEVRAVALEMVVADGTALPVLVSARVKTDATGRPLLIRATISDARDRRAYEQELLRAKRAADRERASVQLLAATLQRSLIPPSLTQVPGAEVDAYYHFASAAEVGGDFYDLFPLGAGRWGFFLGDVSGKGAVAATFTSLTRYTLRAAAVYDADPISVLGTLNEVLKQEYSSADPRFCTVIFGVLARDGDGFLVDLASGGHPPALMLRSDGSVEFIETPHGQLVGILPEPHFVAASIRVRPGDTLVLYSDGITEARIGRGRFDDDGALREFAAAHSPSTAPSIVADIKKLLESFGDGLQDDVAVLAVSVPAL